MQIDPIEFLTAVRQCEDDGGNKQQLTGWFNLTSLLSLQTHGCAVSENLIKQLQNQLGNALQAIAKMDDNPDNKQHCQWLFNQITEFYRWLNNLSGDSNEQILENWLCWSPNDCLDQDESADCFDEETEETRDDTETDVCQSQTTIKPNSMSSSGKNYNRFD